MHILQPERASGKTSDNSMLLTLSTSHRITECQGLDPPAGAGKPRLGHTGTRPGGF